MSSASNINFYDKIPFSNSRQLHREFVIKFAPKLFFLEVWSNIKSKVDRKENKKKKNKIKENRETKFLFKRCKTHFRRELFLSFLFFDHIDFFFSRKKAKRETFDSKFIVYPQAVRGKSDNGKKRAPKQNESFSICREPFVKRSTLDNLTLGKSHMVAGSSFVSLGLQFGARFFTATSLRTS